MKTKILLSSFAFLALMSCSTTYKVGQTPDDVYFSPAREVDSYTQRDENRDQYRSYNEDEWDDRRLRMRVQSRSNRWSSFDDYSWNYDYRWQNYGWRYDAWTNTWYPVNSYSYYNYPYTYGGHTWVCGTAITVKPSYAFTPQPADRSRWTNTNYNNSNYNTRGSVKNAYLNINNGNPGTRSTNRTSSGSPTRSFSIPSSVLLVHLLPEAVQNRVAEEH
jgi:hypothetical protein